MAGVPWDTWHSWCWHSWCACPWAVALVVLVAVAHCASGHNVLVPVVLRLTPCTMLIVIAWVLPVCMRAHTRVCWVPAYRDGRLRGAPSLVLAEYATRPPCAGAPRMRLGKLGGSV